MHFASLLTKDMQRYSTKAILYSLKEWLHLCETGSEEGEGGGTLKILKALLKVKEEGGLFQIIFGDGQSLWAEKVVCPNLKALHCQQNHQHHQENPSKVILATGAATSVNSLVEGLTGRCCLRLRLKGN